MKKLILLILAICLLCPSIAAADTWLCPICNVERDTNFCGVCRSERPQAKLTITLDDAGKNYIEISWSEQNGTQEYRVYIRKAGTEDWDAVDKTTATNYQITNLEPGTAYDVRVRAGNKDDAVLPNVSTTGKSEPTAEPEPTPTPVPTPTSTPVQTLEPTTTPLPAAAREPFTQVGNIVTYGHYEQDNSTDNGKEPIEWIVLEYDSAAGRSLLLSRYGLDAHRFDASRYYHGWDKSEMRSWLNSTFLSNAFTAKEQAGIVTTKVSTPSYNGHSGGSDTQDKIWLLSRDEAITYFRSDEARKATPTKYAVAQGAYQYSGGDSSLQLNGTGCCWWWLRSPGSFSNGSSAALVSSDGSLYASGVYGAFSSVRPAFWLNLDSADIY